MEGLFWVSLVGAIYSYVIYPVILILLPKTRRGGADPAELPPISLIIAAHNEQTCIRDKLSNALALDYPKEKLEIIVASDASTDDTDSIVGQFAVDGIALARTAERNGKEFAQSLAIQRARGAILVFSDAATMLPPDSLRAVVRNFEDPRVGAVSSEDRFLSPDGELVGEGLYVRYEMWLRKLESDTAGLIGLSGSFFAARREVCSRWDTSVPSDLNTAINAASLGYVAVTDPNLLGYYKAIADERREYQRKFRTVLRGIAGLVNRATALNPFRFGLFAFQLWSHKVMRWLVPWFMLSLLFSSVELFGRSWLVDVVLAGQIILYLMFVGAMLSSRLRRLGPFRVPFFFIQVNLAIAHAFLAYLAGRRLTTWQPSAR